MAKKRTKKASATELPSVQAGEEAATIQVEAGASLNIGSVNAQSSDPVLDLPPEDVPQPVHQEIEDKIAVKLQKIEVPLAEVRHGYEPRRCDVQAMTGKQPEMLRRLTNGLIAEGAKLENGRIVTRQQDAIKWLLEQLAFTVKP